MLVCNDATAFFNHYNIIHKFSYLAGMKVDFGNICRTSDMQDRDEWFWVVFWISLNSVPVLQFLSTGKEVSSQDGCRCNAEWGMKRADNLQQSAFFSAANKRNLSNTWRSCQFSGSFFYVPAKQHPLSSSISVSFRGGSSSSKQGSWLPLLWPVAEKVGLKSHSTKKSFACHSTKKTHFFIYLCFVLLQTKCLTIRTPTVFLSYKEYFIFIKVEFMLKSVL